MYFAGASDKNIKFIETKFKSKLVLRGNELVVDGTKKATITSDGRLLSKGDSLKDKEEHIDLLKHREWGGVE